MLREGEPSSDMLQLPIPSDISKPGQMRAKNSERMEALFQNRLMEVTVFDEIVILTDDSQGQETRNTIMRLVKDNGFNERECFGIDLALEEAIVNAMKHGNELERNKSVIIGYTVTPDLLCVQVTDQGEGFDPADVPDPTLEENLEKPSGRGLMLIDHYMDDVTYSKKANQVIMRKRRGSPEKPIDN